MRFDPKKKNYFYLWWFDGNGIYHTEFLRLISIFFLTEPKNIISWIEIFSINYYYIV